MGKRRVQFVEKDVLSDTARSSASKETTAHDAEESRRIGVIGAVFLILNKMIGTGSELWSLLSRPTSSSQEVVDERKPLPRSNLSVFSIPSSVFAASGSVGFSLILWVLGGIVSAAGLSVYLEYGLAIPKSGGEKNYLERVYRRPQAL